MSAIPKPPEPTQKSAEQQQMDAIADAIRCAEGTIHLLRNEVRLTIGIANDVQTFIAWLENIRVNLRRDWQELYSKLPQAAPVASPVPIQSETKKTRGKK